MKNKLEINLLKNRRTLSEKDYLREVEVLKYSKIGLIGSVVLMVMILSYQLVLSRKLVSLEESIAVVTKQVSEHAEASAQQIYLKSRLNLVSSFLDVRSIARQAIQEIFSIEIPGVIVSGVSFEDDNLMSAQFTANDVLSLENLFDYLESGEGIFTQTVSNGVVRTGEGKYQLQALLTLSMDDKDGGVE